MTSALSPTSVPLASHVYSPALPPTSTPTLAFTVPNNSPVVLSAAQSAYSTSIHSHTSRTATITSMQPSNRPPVPERHTRQHHDHEDAQLHAEHKNPNDSLMNEEDNDNGNGQSLQPLTRRGNWGNQSEQAEPTQPPSATKQGWNSSGNEEEKTNDHNAITSSPNAISAPRFGRRQGGVANTTTIANNNANQYDLDVGEDDAQQTIQPTSYQSNTDDTHIDSDAPAARMDHVAGLHELNDQYSSGVSELPSMIDSVDVSLLLSTIIPSTVSQYSDQQQRSPYEEVDEPWDYQRLFAELSMQLQKKPQKTVDDDEPDDDAAVVAPGKR